MTLAELYERVERCAAEPKTVQRIYVEITNELLAAAGSGAHAKPLSAWPTLYEVTAALRQLQGAGRIKAAGSGVTRTYCAVEAK